MRLSCVERRGCENLDKADQVYIPRGIGCSSRSGGEDREKVWCSPLIMKTSWKNHSVQGSIQNS